MDIIILILVLTIIFNILYKKYKTKQDKFTILNSVFTFLEDDGSEKTLSTISDNKYQYDTALNNPKYRKFLLEKYNEEQLRDYFYKKHNIRFANIYEGEVRVDWEKFKNDLLEYSKKLNKEEVVLVIYGMLITVAREDIRNFVSDRPCWENRWAEECFNQIKTVITLMYQKLIPVLQEDNKIIDYKLNEIRETLEGYCSLEDRYWITVFEQIEEPLRKILSL
jgi:hypothetical protein